jgi:hypothetical protein
MVRSLEEGDHDTLVAFFVAFICQIVVRELSFVVAIRTVQINRHPSLRKKHLLLPEHEC